VRKRKKAVLNQQLYGNKRKIRDYHVSFGKYSFKTPQQKEIGNMFDSEK
jgi:hypothetical protein